MARKATHPMGLVSMLVLLVAIVAFVPWVVRTFVRSVAGFEDTPMDKPGITIPTPAMMGGGNYYVPDARTNYLCRSPNDDGVPCPEGQFCDGTTQQCVNKTVPTFIDQVTGYFS